MTDSRVELGRINRTFLGFEDHGIFTFSIDISFGGTGQGFGGISLGGPYTDFYIKSVLRAVGVESWEDLPGNVVWVERDGPEIFKSKIVAIEAPDFVKHDGRCRLVEKLPDEVREDVLEMLGVRA